MQMRLEGLDPEWKLELAEPSAPPIWVRALRVHRDLEGNPKDMVRSVHLRRGLNVVWAPDEPDDSELLLFANRMGGHTAGKTTFCRFLRYVLGEQSFGTANLRQRIQRHLPEAWVTADVMVADQPWLVARPLHSGSRSFCVQGADGVEAGLEAERSDYSAFLDDVNETALASVSARRFPTREQEIEWFHLLPWMARDQECRFANILDWRHPASEAPPDGLRGEERDFLVRAVLGVVSEQEVSEQIQLRDFLQSRDGLKERRSKLFQKATWESERIEKWAARLLGMEGPVPETGLFRTQIRAELERRTSDVEAELNELRASDRRQELLGVLEGALQDETLARRERDAVEAELQWFEDSLAQLEARDRAEGQRRLLRAFPPSREFCGVPIRVAIEGACPFASAPVRDLDEARSDRTLDDQIASFRTVVQDLRRRAGTAHNAHRAADLQVKEARRALLSESTSWEEEYQTLTRELERLHEMNIALAAAESSWREVEATERRLAEVSEEVDIRKGRTYARRNHKQQALERLSAHFAHILRALLGSEVEGKVAESRGALDLALLHDGLRDSAALTTLKLIAFDLAAMVRSIERSAAVPRLLIHDGPREADLARGIYQRIFLWCIELERLFPGQPGFQYIVTTTSAPPEDVLEGPWLRLQIQGTPTEKRLLRTDL